MKTLYATHIWKLYADTANFTTEDTFCDGPDGIYRCIVAINTQDIWPAPVDGKIPLWRDFWEFFASRDEGPHGPYFQRVLDAHIQTLRIVT